MSRVLLAVLATVSVSFTTAAHADLSRLQALLSTVPDGGWVMSSTTRFSDSFVTGASALPASYGSYGSQNAGATIYAWSSITIDPRTGDLWLAAAGGHANYAGNEVRRNRGDTGAWELASLPSRLDANDYVVDGLAPQSAHQYDNTGWLAQSNKIYSLGGAAFNSGANYAVANGRTGPWLYDPAKADGTKVGGSTGSGWDPSVQGGLMWDNRAPRATGIGIPSHSNGTSASTVVNGHDVVYFTADSNASGWANLYQVTLGNGNESDVYSVVGLARQAFGYKGAGTFDAGRGLYVRTGVGSTSFPGADLTTWRLQSGVAVWDQPVLLTFSNGTAFAVDGNYGIDYDSTHDLYVLWDGEAGGKVYYTQAEFDGSGNLKSTWTVHEAPSQTADQPAGNFSAGVVGKWRYVASLDAYMAVDQMNADGDADVWLYKPFDSIAAVPEPESWLLMLLGGALVVARRRHLLG